MDITFNSPAPQALELKNLVAGDLFLLQGRSTVYMALQKSDYQGRTVVQLHDGVVHTFYLSTKVIQLSGTLTVTEVGGN